MSQNQDESGISRVLLIGMGFLIAVSLAAVVSVKLVEDLGASPPLIEQSRVIESRDLRFVDLGAGKVAVYDWSDGALVRTIEAGDQNFIRGVIRGLARERRLSGAGQVEPFRISRLDDGSLTLEDRATQRVLVLEAFGPTNVRAFESLLSQEAAVPING